MKFSFKQHGEVLAACDADLLGRTICEGDLEICISERFYGGEACDERKMGELLKSHANINLIGKEITAFAKEKGILECTKKIKGIPYAFIFRM